MVVKDEPGFEPNRRFKLDMFNVVLGIIAQLCMTVLPMYVVLSMHLPLLITILILTLIILILKKTWWDKLED
jgi:SSS family solute:Na+ symporter